MSPQQHVRSWAAWVLRTLLPSFLANHLEPDQKWSWKLHPTSYLDGLRGIASLIVFICHYTEENHQYMVPTYGLNPDNQASSWLQLPFIRIVYSGRPMIHVFFIISGFVLSYKPLKAIHANDLEKCYIALSSSAFRRPFRLFGPCAVSTFLVAFLIQAGFIYKPLPTLSAQFAAWKDAMFHSITWPWSWDSDLRPGFDIHLWTIPIEFAHSMLLFLVILLLSRLRLGIRQAGTVFIMVYCLCCGKWAAFEFLGGMFLAEIRTLQSASEGDWTSLEQHRLARSPSLAALVHTLLNFSVVIASVFVWGWPNMDADRTPGIRLMLSRTPSPFAEMDPLAPQKFWFAISAFFVVWSCGEVGRVRRFLEGRVAQYCGRLSYAIYIVHGPVLEILQKRVVGDSFRPASGVPGEPGFVPGVMGTGLKAMVGVDSPSQRLTCWFLGLAILGPLVVWAADVFWRLVDMPIINGARKIEAICLDNVLEQDKQSRERPIGGTCSMSSILPPYSSTLNIRMPELS